MATKKLKKVSSLRELSNLAKTEPRYAALAISAARNLGANLEKEVANNARWLGRKVESEFEAAMSYLEMHAGALEGEYGQENGEESVVAEVNFMR